MDLDHAKSENAEHPGRSDGVFLAGRNHESVQVLPLHCLLSDKVEVSQQTSPAARGRCQTGTEGDELVIDNIAKTPFAARPGFRKVPAGPPGIIAATGVQLLKLDGDRGSYPHTGRFRQDRKSPVIILIVTGGSPEVVHRVHDDTLPP